MQSIATYKRSGGTRQNLESVSSDIQPISNSNGLSLLGSRMRYMLRRKNRNKYKRINSKKPWKNITREGILIHNLLNNKRSSWKRKKGTLTFLPTQTRLHGKLYWMLCWKSFPLQFSLLVHLCQPCSQSIENIVQRVQSCIVRVLLCLHRTPRGCRKNQMVAMIRK